MDQIQEILTYLSWSYIASLSKMNDTSECSIAVQVNNFQKVSFVNFDQIIFTKIQVEKNVNKSDFLKTINLYDCIKWHCKVQQ